MDFRSLSQIIQPLALSVWFPLLIKGNPHTNKLYWWKNSLASLLINTTQLIVYNVSGPDTNLLQKSLRISSGYKMPLRFPIRDFEEELSLTARGRPAIRCHIVCAAIFYIQYSSHWFLLIKNLSSPSPPVTEESFTFPLCYEGCVSRGLIFQSLVIHLWRGAGSYWGREKKKGVWGRTTTMSLLMFSFMCLSMTRRGIRKRQLAK